MLPERLKLIEKPCEGCLKRLESLTGDLRKVYTNLPPRKARLPTAHPPDALQLYVRYTEIRTSRRAEEPSEVRGSVVETPFLKVKLFWLAALRLHFVPLSAKIALVKGIS